MLPRPETPGQPLLPPDAPNIEAVGLGVAQLSATVEELSPRAGTTILSRGPIGARGEAANRRAVGVEVVKLISCRQEPVRMTVTIKGFAQIERRKGAYRPGHVRMVRRAVSAGVRVDIVIAACRSPLNPRALIHVGDIHVGVAGEDRAVRA